MQNKQISFFPLRTAQGFSELTEQELIESTSETLTKKVDELGQDISKAMKQQNKQASGAGKPQSSKTPDKTKDPDKAKKAALSVEDVTTLKQQLHTLSQEMSALREDVRFILHKFKVCWPMYTLKGFLANFMGFLSSINRKKRNISKV